MEFILALFIIALFSTQTISLLLPHPEYPREFKTCSHRNLYRLGQKVYSWEYTKEFILALLFMSYCVILHISNYKPTLAPPCTHKFTAALFLIAKKEKQPECPWKING